MYETREREEVGDCCFSESEREKTGGGLAAAPRSEIERGGIWAALLLQRYGAEKGDDDGNGTVAALLLPFGRKQEEMESRGRCPGIDGERSCCRRCLRI